VRRQEIMIYPGSDLAKYRQADMLREAESYRLSEGSRAARAAEHRAKFRRALVTSVSMLIWPSRH
jgi:hypothetical protein